MEMSFNDSLFYLSVPTCVKRCSDLGVTFMLPSMLANTLTLLSVKLCFHIGTEGSLIGLYYFPPN